jgi:integrase/recombinase XerD
MPSLVTLLTVLHEWVMNDQGRAAREDARAPKDPLVSEAFPRYLEYLRIEKQVVPATVERYTQRMGIFFNDMGDCPVSAINGEKISIYRRRLFDRNLGPTSIGMQLSIMRGFLRYLDEVEQIKVYDAVKIKRPKIPVRPVEYLKLEEVERLIQAISRRTQSGRRDRALVEVLFSTGMRISEALSLDQDRIDWVAREALIIGKRKKQRKVYFTERSITALKDYLQFRHDEEPAVFIATRDEPRRLGAAGTWRRLTRYSQRAGLSKKVYPHMLRHTMATTLLSNGCPIGHIRSMLGHEHLQTTCRYYLGVMTDAENKAAHDKYLNHEASEGVSTDALNGVDPLQRQEIA